MKCVYLSDWKNIKPDEKHVEMKRLTNKSTIFM